LSREHPIPVLQQYPFLKVLDSVSSASDLAKLETIYELTLDALKATANQRHGAHARYARQRQEGNPSGDEK